MAEGEVEFPRLSFVGLKVDSETQESEEEDGISTLKKSSDN